MWAALGQGDFEQAYRAALKISPAGQTPRHNIHDLVDDLLDLIEAAVGAGRPNEARERAEEAHCLKLADISPRVEAITLAMSAMTATYARAGDLYRSALAHPGLADFPFELNRITLAYGVWLRRQRRCVEARDALGAAAEGFDRLGAHPWAERARTELLAAGAPTTQCLSETATLSTQERRIAELAAVGRPTRQIAELLSISPRTVDAHLYRVYRKLLISRRAQLADALFGGQESVEPMPQPLGGEGH